MCNSIYAFGTVKVVESDHDYCKKKKIFRHKVHVFLQLLLVGQQRMTETRSIKIIFHTSVPRKLELCETPQLY